MAIVESVLLAIELSVEVSVLLLSVDEQVPLIIDLLSKGRDHANVGLDTTLVVVLHAPLVVRYSVEVLLEVQQLLLQLLVFTLSLSQLHGFLSQLGYQAVFVVLVSSGVLQFPLRTLGHTFLLIFNFLIDKLS